MSFLCIGDIHFNVKNSIESDEFISELYKHLENNVYDFVVILGDILHTFEQSQQSSFNRASSLLISLNKICKTYLIIGNHDRPNNNVFMTDEHFFNSFKKYKNIRVIDKTLRDGDYIFVPYVAPGRFKEALNDIDKKNVKCIFAHQEFKGCKLGMLKSEIGDVWSEEDIPIISGHIHDFHIPQKNIFYVPTPFQHGFSDNGEKFICNFKINDNRGELYINNIYYNKIFLNITKKRLLDMTLEEFKNHKVDKNYITKIMLNGDSKIINEYLKKCEKNNYIRIQIIDIKNKNECIEYKKNNDKSLKQLIEEKINKESDELIKEYKRIYKN